MFCSQDIQSFVFLINPQISKSTMLSVITVHYKFSFKYQSEIWLYSNATAEGLVFSCCEYRKLVPGPFLILMKQQCGGIY